MNKAEFLAFVKKECLKDSMDFKTFPGDKALTVMTASPCSGFFEENKTIKPTLGIAEGLPDQTFFEVLAHEFSHSRQFMENSPYWTMSRLTPEEVTKFSTRANISVDSLETGDVIGMWWDRKIELTNEESWDLTVRTTGVEFDCEKRTVALIKDLGLSLNTDEYSQKANAYVAAYFFARKYRRFTTPGHSTYTKKEVWSLFPTELDLDFCQNQREAIESAIFTHCIKD